MDRKAFFDALRGSAAFAASIPQSAVETIDAILDEAERRGTKLTHLAYILATARWECLEDMKPKRENLYFTSAKRIRQVWPSRFKSDAAAQPFVKNPRALANQVYNGRMGNRPGSDDGYRYRGGGLPQLTGAENYQRAGRALGLALADDPDLMLDLGIAIMVMFEGMINGWFTGYSLADAERIPGYTDDRKIINGTDQALVVARIAGAFEDALEAGGWPKDGPEPSGMLAISAARPAPRHSEDEEAIAWAEWINGAPPGALAWLRGMPLREGKA